MLALDLDTLELDKQLGQLDLDPLDLDPQYMVIIWVFHQ